MRPRFADPRLGVSFMEVSQIENDRKGLKSTFYTKRWRVEPVDELAISPGRNSRSKETDCVLYGHVDAQGVAALH